MKTVRLSELWVCGAKRFPVSSRLVSSEIIQMLVHVKHQAEGESAPLSICVYIRVAWCPAKSNTTRAWLSWSYCKAPLYSELRVYGSFSNTLLYPANTVHQLGRALAWYVAKHAPCMPGGKKSSSALAARVGDITGCSQSPQTSISEAGAQSHS